MISAKIGLHWSATNRLVLDTKFGDNLVDGFVAPPFTKKYIKNNLYDYLNTSEKINRWSQPNGVIMSPDFLETDKLNLRLKYWLWASNFNKTEHYK